MFDPNSQLRELAFLKDKSPTTWQDMVRQNRDPDVDPRLYRVHTESRLSAFVAGLAVRFRRARSSLLSRANVAQVRRAKQSWPRHSTIDR